MKVATTRFWKWTGWSAAVLVGSFAMFVAYAHTPWGRPMLAMMSSVPGCPEGFGGGDVSKIEAMRRGTIEARTADAVSAADRSALGFELGTTTRAQVIQTLGDSFERCKTIRGGQVIQCGANEVVGLEALASNCDLTVTDLHLQFDGDVLVTVDVMRKTSDAAVAVDHFSRQVHDLSQRVGEPSKMHGQVEPGWLSAQPLRQAASEFRARGYVAQVSVTNMGGRGLTVREQYQWTAM